MEKVAGGYKLHEKIKWQGIWTIVLAIGIAVLYGSRVSSLHTVWELGDEAGYLWNAAYFTGTNWDCIAPLYSYYGYGYSIILCPLFWITGNGIQLIQGVYIINILCVIGMYLILVKLLAELEGKSCSPFIPIIAFTACLLPYVASNTLKALCEVFLSFWYCLLIYLLYLVLKRPKLIYVIMLGICSAFFFFIHTRAIVAIGVIMAVYFFSVLWKKKKYLKYFLMCFFIMGIVFLLLYSVKSEIIIYKNILKQAEEITEKEANLITAKYFFDRLNWFDPVNYSACFITKIIYVIYATGTVLLPGSICMIKQIYSVLEESENTLEDCAASIIKVLILLAFAVMIAACTFNGMGNDLRYAVYGRYYEFMLPPIFCFSLYSFISDPMRISRREIAVCIVVTLVMGMGTRVWCTSYLKDQSMFIDTNRIAAISKPISLSENMGEMLNYVTLSCGILLFCCMAFYKRRYGEWLVILLTGIAIWGNTKACIDKIQEVQNNQAGDKEIAEYILSHREDENVYMIDDNSYKYIFFYSKLQILLKDIPLHVIKPEENKNIVDNSYVLTYVSTKLKDSFLAEYEPLKSGSIFLLYYNSNEKE